jgi:hypothetical protein
MRATTYIPRHKCALRLPAVLLFSALGALGQQQVNLTAGPATLTLPDGSPVPMWGYSCGTAVSGSTATCASLKPAATGWSPVVITVPTGSDLQINLTNSLSFSNGNSVPTSLVIVGQLGGGLGTGATTTASPDHTNAQPLTWPIAGDVPGQPVTGVGTAPAQGPRVQSFATEVPAGSTASLTWKAPRAGTYLIESGTHPSIQGPMGLYGMLVVTKAPTATSTGVAYIGASILSTAAYDEDFPLLFSEIDPVQNNAVTAAVNTANFSETRVWSGQPGGCGNTSSPTYRTCYPPAVNYTPLYYMINGVAFDKTNASASLFSPTAPTYVRTSGTGTVLVRMVNAGLRMHVPSIVGAQTGAASTPGFALFAEDGNPLPGVPRVQSEVFMAAGKTYDVLINVPAATTPPATALPVYDRELSLSGNAVDRDAGMLAYLGINGAGLPNAAGLGAATANPDAYSVVPGNTLTVSDLSKGVIANDVNVYGVKVATAPTQGALTLNANGTFTYVPNSSWSGGDSFAYCGNNVAATNPLPQACATVTLNAATIEGSTGISVNDATFNSKMATYLNEPAPGPLAFAKDSAGYPLTMTNVKPQSGLTLIAQPNGGFIASVSGPGTYTFTYQAKNSQGSLSGTGGTKSNGIATVTLVFPTPSNLKVSVVDGKDKTTLITDYRWIIEEDRTFYIDPTKTTNSGGSTIVPTLGVNFHTSNMPFVAQGCTGPKSCEAGQTVYDSDPTSPTYGTHINAVCDVGNGVCRPDPTGNGIIQVDPGKVALDPTKRYYISVLPGDAGDPFGAGYTGQPDCSTTGHCGHGMGGAPIGIDPVTHIQQSAVTVLVQPAPYQPGKLSVFVFEDDFPLNGEHDGGGGVDVLAPYEPGLGGFQIHLWDAMGGNGDFTGQMTYDMFNQPLTNSLAGTIDPATGKDACPISPTSDTTFNGTGISASASAAGNTIVVSGIPVDASQVGSTLVITGGQGFTPGLYKITSVSPGTAATGTTPATPGTWTVTPNVPNTQAATGAASGMTGTKTEPNISGMIVTCPTYEADGTTLSPLAGQAVISNLMPGRFGVIATPAADRIARGEEWLQTNTLDGQKAHDSFIRIGEPSYFQEYGPASFHVTIGFANPKIINSRLAGVCGGTDPNITATNCNFTVVGKVTGEHLSRTPDERLYSTGSRDTFYWTQCYVSVGDPDGEDFAFTKCNADGTFSLSGLPQGDWRVTTFDQWNDQLVDGLSTPVGLGANYAKCPGPASTTQSTAGGGSTCDMGDIAATQWQTNLYTRTFIDDNKDGISQSTEAGIPLIPVNVRYRDGSLANNLGTDFNGVANFNETFPLFSWYVVETDTTRYKNTGTHVVYDAGGPVDGSAACGVTGYPPCGNSKIAKNLANTAELVSLPTGLRVPGAVYCSGADCDNKSIQSGPATSDPPSVCTTSNGTTSCSTVLSTGRIDPPWAGVEGWQSFPGQNNFLEFGKTPFAQGENGGIKGHVVYASTRPFDDPQMLVQTQWEPLVPHVTINLYKEGTASDGTKSLTLVDTTQTSSWDDWAQGFRSDGVPNMNCPGQTTADLFYFTLYNQPMYLDAYANGGTALHSLPDNSQFKCYDGMHNWNQIQPAPYDGMYAFPSSTGLDPGTGKSAGTNCTGCTTNPVDGTPMLPLGKYVVEVVMPPGYELVKEEDKNILIGDNFVAPVTQEFGGLGNVFIMPDQASVASSYNANNAQNPTTDLGAVPRSQAVPAFPVEPIWPCVGQARVVPDYISLFPQSQEVAPFAGATRNLCDRKEVTLTDQMSVTAKFYIFTSTHIASKFYGGITDDFTSEFDPFSPQFGEKFAPPDLPVAVRDWTGAETSRVYADQWGQYNGMTYSSWEVNPPNPTGYSPTMMVFCMNDPGPIAGPNGTSVTDPLFNSGYSQFCYELPYMPGQTQYLDTPVVPTSAFSEGYNHPDCAYPTLTPAVSSVVGDAPYNGPWVSKAGNPLTINALGNQTVNNYGYSGPSATTSPFNQKTITRHYGFGSAQGTVTIGGVAATVTSWGDTQIVVTVPATGSGAGQIHPCSVQQQTLYRSGAGTSYCGQLVITAASGQQSVDAVTVTVGGKAPTVVTSTIQAAIDSASPGDMIIVPPGTYNEMVIMWKPVRLQGVGAASSVINASTQPAGKMDPWRAKVSCLFGLATNGQPYTTPGGAISNVPSLTNTNPFDPTNSFTCGGWNGFTGTFNNPQVDRLPLEGILGWDTTVNGNLAELLQEPTLLGAYEGSGILVLSKGVNVPANATSSYYGSGAEASFPTGTLVLTQNDCTTGPNNTNPYPSNFQCNPSSIDGLAVTDSSQGGGGIFVHAWGHNLQIANNRVYNNIGTLSGGINIGQGESPDAYLAGTAADSDPGSCNSGAGLPANTQLPYCFDLNVNVHNNYVVQNTSIGDELFSGTPAGAGGVSFCTGADYYQFNYNWVCGNMSTGDGGGFSHLGFIWNGDVEHNTVIFNQSLNPTIATNGGGMIIMGAAPDGSTAAGVECGGTIADADCTPGLPDGTGPGLLINANYIVGNAAESGSGGGLRLQSVNGTDTANFPNGNPGNSSTPGASTPWNTVAVTNNIIANNVAGWDGAGISLQDALAVNLVNNTIMSNDTTASSGVLFNTLGAPLASAPGATNQCGGNSCTSSAPQPAGLVTMSNSPQLLAAWAALPAGTKISCPAGHANCTSISNPLIANDVFWQNRTYFIGVGSYSSAYQQNVVALYNSSFNGTPAVLAPSQPQAEATMANGNGVVITGGTGACTTATYWDLGVRGDTGPGNHGSGFTLTPMYSVLTNTSEDAGTNDFPGVNPQVLSQYCNGSRTPPEFGSAGWQVPPGISDATVPNPIFNLTPAATVDEGNNWVNMQWGPLSLVNPVTNAALGNYAPATGSPVIDVIPVTSAAGSLAPKTDFFGHGRPDASDTKIDVGAVEFQVGPPPTLTSIAPSSGSEGMSVPVTLTGTNLAGASAINVTVLGVPTQIAVSNLVVVNSTTITATFTIPLTTLPGPKTVTVTTPAGTTNGVTFNVTTPPTPTLTSISPNSGVRGTSVPVTITGTNFTSTGDLLIITPFFGSGITASNFTVVNSTTITATFGISGTTGTGNRSLTITTLGGTSNALTFAVTLPAGPTLTSIAPTAGLRGTNVNVTLNGANLSGASGITVSGTGVAVAANSIHVVSSTQVTATFTIAATATLSARTVQITTPGGTTSATGAPTFTVQGGTAGFSGPTPALTTTPATTATKSGTITVTNTATGLTAGTLTLTAAPTITRSAGTGTFSITGGSCASGLVLNAGASCTVIVKYVPGGTGTSTAHITVSDTGAATGTQNSPNFNGN